MSDTYYVWIERGGKDASRDILIVPKDLFDKLKPFEDELGAGSWEEAQPWIDQALDGIDADLRPSEAEALDEDHVIFVTSC